MQKYSQTQLRDYQLSDSHIPPLVLWKEESSTRPTMNMLINKEPSIRYLWLCWETLYLQDGVLIKKNSEDDSPKLVVPQMLQDEVLKNCHNCLISGHLGHKKTRHRVKQDFFWYKLKESMVEWVLKCDPCAANRRPHTPKAPMGDMSVGNVLDRIGTDFVGPLPKTLRGNAYLLVVQDYFTKWVEIYPVPDCTAETTARVLLNEFFAKYGTPLQLISDQGRNYESVLLKELCKILNIEKIRTSPRHPCCNGMVERFNATIIRMIKSYLENETEWDLNVGCLSAAYRSSVHESTQFTPNMMMFGREVRMPVNLMLGDPPYEQHSEVEYVQKIKENIQKAHCLARKYLKQSRRRQCESHDVKISLNNYPPGGVVWCINETRKPRQCKKLQPLWQGPFLVMKKLSDLDYEIKVK